MCTAVGFLTSPTWGGACSVLVCLSALGFALAVFLSLTVCPRWLSSGFSAVSSSVGGGSRFRRSADRLRLSDVAPCLWAVCPALGGCSCSFLPCYPVGGLCPIIRCRVLPFRLVRSLIPVIYSLCALGAVLTCQRSRGRSLRLSAVGGFYFGCRSPT